MKREIYDAYLRILKSELLPAMGCTEPIAIAYASALAKSILNEDVKAVKVYASANIIKNVKSVVVPATGGKRGIATATAVGIVAGDPELKLQVLSNVTEDDYAKIDTFLENVPCEIQKSEKPYIFHIKIELHSENHIAISEIAGQHTNVIYLAVDNNVFVNKEYKDEEKPLDDYKLLSVEGIVDFADTVLVSDVEETLNRQIDYNTAIAEEGLKGTYGAGVGRTLLSAYGDCVHNKAKAYASAGSDARMNGCEMPVVINSGSGNQGMTASLPVIIYAKEMKVTYEELLRALVVSNLVTIHMKTDIGRLSAYCGATSAGCGAGAGVCYLHKGRAYEISHTIVNAVAINSGMICDGAKASCAAKIASAVDAGLLGFQMQQQNKQFYSGEGIITKGVENTIRNVGRVARLGMAETDKEIIRIMMND